MKGAAAGISLARRRGHSPASFTPATLLDLQLIASRTPRLAKSHQVELKRQIASLKKELSRAEQQSPVVDEGAIAAAVAKAIAARDRQWQPILDEANSSISQLNRGFEQIAALCQVDDWQRETLNPPSEWPEGVTAAQPMHTNRVRTHGRGESGGKPTHAVHAPAVARNNSRNHLVTDPATMGEVDLRPAHQRILNALAWLAVHGLDRPDRSLVAAVAGVSPRSSSYANNVSRLSSLGLVAYPQQGSLQLTAAGADLARAPQEALSLADYHQAWRDCPALRPAHVRLLDVVIDHHPSAISREDLAEHAGVSPSSSSYANNVSRMSSFGLIRYPEQGMVAATELLFPEGLR